MKINFLLKFLLIAILSIGNSSLASVWTNWKEFPVDPIYNPYGTQILPEDYWPFVIFNKNLFNGDGDRSFYKMWHQGPNGIAISYSIDGSFWRLKGDTTLSNLFHPCIIYDPNGFGGGPYNYRGWFWTGVAGVTPDVIQYSFSTDGINWLTPQPAMQDASSPIVTGISPGYFYHLYGPGFVIYNPNSTSTPGQPYTFPYVMFFDTSTEGTGPGLSVEQIGLAYSNDGVTWTRFGSVPIVIPSGSATAWDGNYAFRPSIILVQGIYHMFYSGSNDLIDPLTTIPYAHGIGHASSSDGINWTLDPDNPIFIYSDGVAWRNSRTYTPSVLFDPFCTAAVRTCAKMWFDGGQGTVAGEDQAIGLATLTCPY